MRSRMYIILIDYYLNNGQYFSYEYRFQFGNKIDELPNGGTNTNTSYGKFEYDDYINPYFLWGFTDEYLRYSSANNEINAEYTYGGGFPIFIPGTYSYTYDQEGYPVQLVKTYLTYQTHSFGYREKIIYNYD
jgi:hypothetical protein